MATDAAVMDKPKLLSELPQRLHHHAYVVRDQEANRRFVEDLVASSLASTPPRSPSP